MDIFAVLAVGLLGSALGSFAGAQVWRLRAAQLVDDEEAGEKINKKELQSLRPLLGKKLKEDRSRCLSCRHVLAWYDLVPLASWLVLRGRCRYCKKPIGWTEIALEVVLGGLFVLSLLLWPASFTDPLEVVKLVIWLAALVALAINFVYDMRWLLLVSGLNWLLIALGAVFAGISLFQAEGGLLAQVWSLAGAGAILGGLYGVLWLVSRGRLVGEGDIYLGTGLALFLGDWRLAFVALFAANLIGTLIVLPLFVSGKLKRGSHVPFGPLLILGGLVAWFAGPAIVSWYQNLLFLSIVLMLQ